jgi:hypothetical protein
MHDNHASRKQRRTIERKQRHSERSSDKREDQRTLEEYLMKRQEEQRPLLQQNA